MKSSLSKYFVISTFALCAPVACFAAGVVTTPDEPSLLTALAGGGLVTFDCDGTINLSSTLVITNNTVVDGNGHTITISGNNAVRVFQVNPGVQLTLQNLTVANGSSTQGAGLYNDGGIVTGSNVVFQSNLAHGNNGVSSTSPTSGGPAYGGGVYNNAGSLTLVGCTLTANYAAGGTGGSFSGGDPAMGSGAAAGNGSGGAIFTTGNLYLTNCAFSSNQATGGGGGNAAISGGTPGQGGNAYGGAIVNQGGSINGSNCNFLQNTATGGTCPGLRSPTYYRGLAQGGAVCNLGGAVNLAGGSFVSNAILGSPASGGAVFHAGSTLALSSATIISNTVTGDASTVYYASAGSTGSGGGVFNGTTATLTDCNISSNKVSGGLGVSLGSLVGMGGPANGAGVCNAGTLNLSRCALAGNVATGGTGGHGLPGGPGGAASGGGLFNNGNTANLINCTMVGNSAVGGPGEEVGGAGGSGSGGGIYNINGNANAISLTNCTLLGNRVLGGTNGAPSSFVGFAAGGNIARASGGIRLINTILAGGMSTNASGTLTDLGNNISSDASCAFSAPGSLNSTDPKLGSFGNYGGPTPTLPLLVDSPAMDAANNAAAPATDQRGVTRPRGSSSDIGAFELVTIILSQPQSQTVIAGTPASMSVGLQGNGPSSFQWKFNGTNLPGATDNPLSFPTVLLEQAGIYAVTVSNEVGIVTSSNATLTVLPYLITAQPQSHSAYVGTASSFSIGIQAADPKTFQWKLNGTNLAGANSSTLTLPNVTPADAGIYSVVVSNAYGVAASSNAALTVLFTVGQALGEPGLIWQGSGNLDWFAETNITHDGVALQSSPIAGNQQSTVSTTVMGPGTVSFWWRISSEEDADYLRFFIGATAMAKISGEVDWQQKSFTIPAGPQTLQWVYRKDVDVSSGLDAGWLDQVRFANNRLDNFTWQPSQGFQFRNGMSSGTYVIDASTNLTDWVAISTNTISSGQTVPLYLDSASTNVPYRFYRARQQ